MFAGSIVATEEEVKVDPEIPSYSKVSAISSNIS